jgi:hypothetical protein
MPTHVSAAEAARMYGLSEKTVRRWIKSGQLRADKSAGAYSVALEDVSAMAGRRSASGTDSGADVGTDRSAEDAHPPEAPGTDIMRAEAMAAYTRSILEPLVSLVAQRETTIRDQAETIGTLRAELASARDEVHAFTDSAASETAQPTPRSPGTFLRAWARLDWLVVALVVAVVVTGVLLAVRR